MIPKHLHFCWFGGAVMPREVSDNITAWRTLLPDWEITVWGEDNYELKTAYARDAYRARKWAFVSDCVRAEVLSTFGGIYLDTDVKPVRTPDDGILSSPCVLGFEAGNYIGTAFLACEANHPLISALAEQYQSVPFDASTPVTNVCILTEMLCQSGLRRNGQHQTIAYQGSSVAVYPTAYFSPYDYRVGVLHTTEDTVCIHTFSVSWLPFTARLRRVCKRIFIGLFGERCYRLLRLHEHEDSAT